MAGTTEAATPATPSGEPADDPAVGRGPTPADAGVPERRPGDVGMLVIGVLGVVIAGMWAQAVTTVDVALVKVVNELPTSLEGLANAFAFLGSIWFVGIVVVVLLLARWFLAARDAAIAGVASWLIALGLNELFGTHSVGGFRVLTGDGPAFPAATVAVAAGLAVALAPYLIRPLRRTAGLLVILVAISAMFLGTGLGSDALGGLFLGLAVAASVHLAFGAPGGRPSNDEIRDALTELGFEVVELRPSDMDVPRATVMDVDLPGDQRGRVIAFGRDQRDGQFAAKVWHALMYKEPGLPVFGSRLQQVEHVAYALLLAEKAGARVPRVLKTGLAGPDAAVLVTDIPAGRTLTELAPDDLDDALLAAIWAELHTLHASGIAHGDLEPGRILVDGDAAGSPGGATVGFTDLGTAQVTAESYWRDRDDAAVLVQTSLIVGNDRAIAAAVTALGKERIAEVLPLVQPAALPKSTGAGIKHFGKVLKALRTEVATAAGVEDVAPLKVKRLSLMNIGMLAGVLLALAIAIPSLEDVNWASVQSQFENATWGWAVLAFILYPLVPMSWATALMGCVTIDLPFVPTALTQLACTFLNLITPNGIGGTALQLDYLHHEGVPVASGASAMVLSTGVGGAIQMILFLVAAALTATQVDTSSSGGTVSLGMIAVVAALIGVILWIPKVRNKVVPAVKRAASDIWSVLRNPKKGAQLFGGDTAGNLIYPFLLGLCLMAFHAHLGFAQLVVVQVGAGMLGNVAPVPGGIGVQEAALTAGLTSFGIDANTALATVLVFRGITFAIPPIFGFFTLRYLRARGYA